MNPLEAKPPQLLPDDLRVLAFGASRTWGAGMPDRYDAYPWLLSKNASNLAIRASGPEYPSLCTYSMVGEQHDYDVIVLEFYMDTRNLLRLATRLRHRFPNAYIIFLRVWGPLQFIYQSDSDPKPVNFKDFMHIWREGNKELSIHDPEFRKYVLERTESSDWTFNTHPNSIERQDEALRKVNGILIEVPVPTDLRSGLVDYAHLSSPDLVHWSKAGHRNVATLIAAALKERKARRQELVQPWDSKDLCLSWYETGETSLRYSRDVVMKKFSTDRHAKGGSVNDYHGKYALESKYQGQNVIEIYNPDKAPASVFARFMTIGPPPSKYPKTLLRVSNGLSLPGGVEVNPAVKDYTHYVHINKLKNLGTIPPGNSTLQVIPKENSTVYPFRITGVVVTRLDPVDTLRVEV